MLSGAAGAGGACTPDNGIVFMDAHHCFYRADPTYSVREWGALCDVASVSSVGTLSSIWNPGSSGSTTGTITVPTALLPAPPVPGENIAVSQIGSLTLWETALPAVSMTRFSMLGGTQSNYAAGDLISFTGPSNPGSFSQQAAIIVDAVSGGTITQWHFLWGGLYQAGTQPTGAMVQDDAHSYCGTSGGTVITCGTTSGQAVGATMVPAWSGWSVLNSQSISNPGTGYAVGDIVTLTATGAVANQGHYPKLIVENTTSGGVTAYDWLDYGSFAFSTATSTGTLSASGSSGAGTGLAFNPVAWTLGTYPTSPPIALPSTFGASTRTSGASVPNVYAQP